MLAELSYVICGGIVLLLQVFVRVYAFVCERCGLFGYHYFYYYYYESHLRIPQQEEFPRSRGLLNRARQRRDNYIHATEKRIE